MRVSDEDLDTYVQTAVTPETFKRTCLDLRELRAQHKIISESLTRAQNECTMLLLELRKRRAEETQESITKWANETFGRSASNLRIAIRANEEMAELLRALSVDDAHEKALEECADVVIVLLRLISYLGGDLNEAIDQKMAINRSRQWNLDGNGHGYHVRQK